MFGDDQDPKVGKKTQFPHNDPTRGGRKRSIRKQLYKLLESEGVLKIPKDQVMRIDKKTGEVLIKIPTEMQLALKLMNMSISGNNNVSLQALKLYMEQIDGKPTQPIEVAPHLPDDLDPKDRVQKIEEMMKILNGKTD